MKITSLISLAIAASALAGPLAEAGNPKLTNSTNKRQQTQHERVRKGVQSDEPTRKQLDQAGEQIREEKPDAPQR